MKIISSELYVKDNKVYHEGNKPKPKDIGAAPETHTHNYASATTPGGSAEHAIKATEDSLGQRIDTYIKGLSVSGRTITYTRGDGTTGTITTQDTNTDTKVTNTLNTTAKAYITGTTDSATNTGTQVFDTNVYLDTTAGMLTATTFKGALQGNATTATSATSASHAAKLTTPRSINGTNFDGTAAITTANWGTARTLTIGNTGKSVNGSGNVSWSIGEIGAAPTVHNHTSLTGITNLSFAAEGTDSASITTTVEGVNTYFDFNLSDDPGHEDMWRWRFSPNGGKLFNAMTLDAISTTEAKLAVTGEVQATRLKGTLTGDVKGNVTGTVSGNAGSATKLATARTINGTNFDGTGNITTANWGTARNIQIGNAVKSVNGSGNVTWSLSEIGAAAANHTHSYLPLSGGNVTGRLNVGGRCILPPVYHYSNGILINICAAADATMVAIHVTGNSYGAGVPINSLFNFYDYTPNEGIINASGIHHGYNIGNMTVYRNNGRLYAWIKQPAPFQTYNIEIITNGKTIDASLSDAAIHSSGNTNSITITPSQASLNGHTHSYLPLSGGTISGETVFNNYLSLNAWPGYGTGKAQIWYNGNNKQLVVQPNAVTDIIVNNNKVYHAGNKPTPSEIGAAAASHTHNYLPLSGGTMTGAMTSSLTSSTHIAANKGTAIINSTAAGAGYNMLAKMNSTNGVWTMGSWGTSFNLFYTANTTITAGTNAVTKAVKLIDESGNSSFPGTVSASSFSGSLSGNASTATKLQTARTIALGGILSGSASFDGSGNVTINATANDITTITKSLKVTTSWMDTGITGTNLTTGTYAVQMYVNDGTNIGQYQETYSGIMSWFNGTTNSGDADEILLHKAGHASNGKHVYLRTIRTTNSGYLKLQICSSSAFAAASSITFKFKKLI